MERNTNEISSKKKQTNNWSSNWIKWIIFCFAVMKTWYSTCHKRCERLKHYLCHQYLLCSSAKTTICVKWKNLQWNTQKKINPLRMELREHKKNILKNVYITNRETTVQICWMCETYAPVKFEWYAHSCVFNGPVYV